MLLIKSKVYYEIWLLTYWDIIIFNWSIEMTFETNILNEYLTKYNYFQLLHGLGNIVNNSENMTKYVR